MSQQEVCDEITVPDDKMEVETTSDEDTNYINDGYDWEMIPKRNSDDTKTGVTFKGNSSEYLKGHEKLSQMMTKKEKRYFVNGRELRILDNAKNKPTKVEIKPLKGPSGKVNIKIYSVNAKGSATMMVSKVSDGGLSHVKALAFKVVKYILDGYIDGEINDKEEFQKNPNGVGAKIGDLTDESLDCDSCAKTFKTKHGMNIHIAKAHKNESNNGVEVIVKQLLIQCNVCQ